MAAMAKWADGPHLETQPAQGRPGLGGVEVEDVDTRRAGEDVLDRVQLLLDLDGMLADHPQGPVTHRAQDVRPPQLDPRPAHHQFHARLRHPPFLAD
jgi:hypothetical protein